MSDRQSSMSTGMASQRSTTSSNESLESASMPPGSGTLHREPFVLLQVEVEHLATDLE